MNELDLNRNQNTTGPRFAYSLKPEYPAGKLFENEQALEKDLIFQTGCIAGLGKLLQPNTPWGASLFSTKKL